MKMTSFNPQNAEVVASFQTIDEFNAENPRTRLKALESNRDLSGLYQNYLDTKKVAMYAFTDATKRSATTGQTVHEILALVPEWETAQKQAEIAFTAYEYALQQATLIN